MAVVYIYYNQPDLFPELTIMIDDIIKPGKRGNLFPHLSKTPVSKTPGEPDNDFGPGWIGGAGTFRMLAATLTKWIPNPSGDMFYFYLAICGEVLSATVNNLVIGRTYQLSVYMNVYFDHTIFRVMMDDQILVPKMTNTIKTNPDPTQNKTSEFIRVGPIKARATATSHTIHFCNDTVAITGPNVLMGNFAPIILTGLLFEYK